MPGDESTNFLPIVPIEPERPQRNRAILGVLTLLVLAAVLLALWFLVFDDDDASESANDNVGTALPTPLPIPTSTPSPGAATGIDETESGEGSASSPLPTPLATTEPTPVPEGFEACGPDRAPSSTSLYIVDTTTTPLNQRTDPSVASEAVGAFDPGETGLVFTGECLVNLGDGYVWWQIDNGTADVWVASEFVSPG